MGLWVGAESTAAFEEAFYSSTLTVLSRSQTSVTVSDLSGNKMVFEGSAFTYDEDRLVGGIVTSASFVSDTGVTLASGSGIAVDVAGSPIDLVDLGGIGLLLLSGNDRVEGSADRDVMSGCGGDDVLFGRGGRDVFGLFGGGQDRLTGGGGADQFVFTANRGTDRITDFADNGSAQDDVIVLTRKLYGAMTLTQTGDNVLLDFGASGKLLLLNTVVEDIGAEDFKVGSFWEWQ